MILHNRRAEDRTTERLWSVIVALTFALIWVKFPEILCYIWGFH